MLNLEDFDYDLPESLIAQVPSDKRQDAKLLISHIDSSVSHSIFSKMIEAIPANSVIVLNDTRVIAGRLIGHLETGGKIEIFLIRQEQNSEWIALGRPLKKLKIGTTINFEDNISAVVTNKQTTADDSQFLNIEFSKANAYLMPWLDKNGFIPLPPYIKRTDPAKAPESTDRERYQTVYAKTNGSVAAPTAGLHFTDEIIEKLKSKGVKIRTVCLHVGAGTFLPVKSSEALGRFTVFSYTLIIGTKVFHLC